MKAVPIQRLRPPKATFEGQLHHRGATNTSAIFYSNKIEGDVSVAADECTYKCKYCVLIYSNN